jgi:ribosomal protein L14
VTAAEAILARQKFVTAVDVCLGIGWLNSTHLDRWRQGRVDSLTCLLPVQQDKLTQFFECLQRWAQAHDLNPAETDYVSATRDRRQLRFSTDAHPAAERAWRTHWIPADLPVAQQERIVKRQAKAPDLVVVLPVKDWDCAECGGTGDLLIMDDQGPLCMTCADLDHLVFLGAGDAALTRRAKKASVLSAVVVRWSRTRKRYERQGILVEEAALDQAEQECLADEDARMRRRDRDRERRAGQDVELQARMAEEIRRLFPRCPPERADAIARHTALRGSGRVGRSAAGRALGEQAITLAVVASVRHQDTDYDSLLMSGVRRDAARDQIRPSIDRVLASWM